MSANVGMPLQFTRMYNGPLDDTEVFETLETAEEYASSAVAYAGQYISVKEPEYRRSGYIINDDNNISLFLNGKEVTFKI